MYKVPPFIVFLSALFVLLLLVSGCETTGGARQPKIPTLTARELPADVMAQAQELLTRAKLAQPPDRADYLIQTAQLLIKADLHELVGEILTATAQEKLTFSQELDLRLLQAQLALAQGDVDAALKLIERLGKPTHPAQQRAVGLVRAQALGLAGDHVAAARERINLSALLTSEQRDANDDAIWHELQAIPWQALEQLANDSTEALERGWFELAAIMAEPYAELEDQLARTQRWQARWPRHPAAKRIPPSVAALPQLVAQRPNHVALLVPLEGNLGAAGRAIRDGFMAAYYFAFGNGAHTPELHVYDTTNADPVNLYYQAVSSGAQLVVGPLEKTNVSLLNALSERPVPVLALNYLPTTEHAGSNFYQFGLAPEDEAEQVAHQAWRKGYRRALVFYPEGEWGERISGTFNALWLELGGDITLSSSFGRLSTLDDSVAHALLIADSELRAKRVTRILGEEPEFYPRRRKDLDFVFLISRPVEARVLKPMLAFYFAGDLPVYSTSAVYTGVTATSQDSDLNGIRFCDMPWRISDDPIKAQMQKGLSGASGNLSTLFALGVDAYRLYPRLGLLLAHSDSQYYGVTGALRMPDGHRVKRGLMWAQFVDGRPEAMPMVVSGKL